MAWIRIPVVAGALLALSGCATALRGTREVLLIESQPAGAEVRVSNGMVCTTPCALDLSHRHGYGLEFLLPGYEKQAVAVRSDVTFGGAAGAAANVTVIGLPVDAFSGAMRAFTPNPVRAVLQPSAPAP